MLHRTPLFRLVVFAGAALTAALAAVFPAYTPAISPAAAGSPPRPYRLALPVIRSGRAGSAPISVPADVPLRGLADERAFFIGAAVDAAWYTEDPNYDRLISTEFNLVTPENVMKFERIHPNPGEYNFVEADKFVAAAEKHHQKVRGHTLVWDIQLPDWITDASFTRQEAMDVLRDHIATVVGRYRGRVLAWDVVNEPLDENGALRPTPWLNWIGPDYVRLAFEWAHAADPQALLFLNEFGSEGLGPKSDGVYNLAAQLLAAGVPVHGVGLEMHTYLGGPPDLEGLRLNMDRLAALGLQVHITEMDVRVNVDASAVSERLRRQAELYGQVLSTCLAVPACRALVTWGVDDLNSWIQWRVSEPEAPLLFDRDGQPKPAYYAVQEALR